MNGLTGPRRSARPVRIALATLLGGDIDGAWWPHSASMSAELPELIGALQRPLGEIFDIAINWSATDCAPDLNSMRHPEKSMPGRRARPHRLMVVAGRRDCAKLLVVPYMTSAALGLMVMRRAAAIPILDEQHETQLYKTADCVVRAAQTESALWAAQMRNGQATESLAAQTVDTP